MDVIGSEIGHKMRSAIKAKLTELGCYVDDELPDYVMVMVANKRTRGQMEDDLQLFLGDNTELFVNWLHQVLKKLQEVTVTAPLKAAEAEKSKDKLKEKKSKDKEKGKKADSLKKAKKKDREKSKKKEEKKSKKKSKHHEMIRPNIPPLLMNMEKESEPSITDVFAGQILKNHGITLDIPKDEQVDEKVFIKEKRPIIPIIDPATISSQSDSASQPADLEAQETSTSDNQSTTAPRDEQIKEINDIEAKIQGLKQKLAEQLDSMSDDEDFLNIRTEAEELMNDFAEDVFQEISQQAPVNTPPLQQRKTPTPPPPPIVTKPPEPPKEPETLPQIELKLPKRPVRDRLGAKEEVKKVVEVKESAETRTKSPERFTPERDPDFFWGRGKFAKSRTKDHPEPPKKPSVADDSDKPGTSIKKITSKVSVKPRARTCASVVHVRPRPRAPASSLLLRAVADAHKSLLNIPPKIDTDPPKVKRALVLPMRRCVDAQKIVIQVPGGDRAEVPDDSISIGDDCDDDSFKESTNIEKDEYLPVSITKKIYNDDYVPSHRHRRTSSRRDDTLVIETINIHNPTVGKEEGTQFIVTMDGFNTNAFLAKKLRTEGLLEDDELKDKQEPASVLKIADPVKKIDDTDTETKENIDNKKESESNEEAKSSVQKKRLSNASEDGNTLSVIQQNDNIEMHNVSNDSSKGTVNSDRKPEKRKSIAGEKRKSDTPLYNVDSGTSPEKRKSHGTEKRKNSDIITDKKKISDTSTDRRKVRDGSTEKKKTSETPTEKRTSSESVDTKNVETLKPETEDSHIKKRRASPIVFHAKKKERGKERERTESASSDNHVVVTTTTNTNKYDSLPPLSQAERKLVWCRSFPLCRYGATCAFQHPRCKFAAACTRRNCVYSHGPRAALTPPPVLASHVVPVPNYKTISPAVPGICKFYPACSNAACHFAHPKPCRYGKACGNKLECNFYHNDEPSKWRFPV